MAITESLYSPIEGRLRSSKIRRITDFTSVNPGESATITVPTCPVHDSCRLHGLSLHSITFIPELTGFDLFRKLISFCKLHHQSDDIVLIGCTIVYFELSLHVKPFPPGASRRVKCKRLIAAATLASKWVDDSHPENLEWSKCLGISLSSFNRQERDMFALLDFNAFVSNSEMDLVRPIIPYILNS